MVESIIVPVLLGAIVGLLATALRITWNASQDALAKNHANAAEIAVLKEKIENVADDLDELRPKP